MSKTEIQTLPGDPFGWGPTSLRDRLAEVDTAQDAPDYRSPAVAYSIKKWRGYPQLRTFFPLRFRAGGQWNRLSFGCGDCKAYGRGQAKYGIDEVRGHVGRMAYDVNGNVREVYAVEAALLCPVCDKFTFFTILLPDTMQLVCMETVDGKQTWATYGEPSPYPSRWRRMVNWVRRLFRRDSTDEDEEA